MKKIKAFFTALVLILCVALGTHLFTAAAAKKEQDGLYAWTDETKYASMHALSSSIDEDTIPVMGSSELQHQKSTPYNPGNLFQDQDIKPLLIGAGYYQSLFHATALSAMEPEMENRKTVLILAPQWFRKSGVRPEAFASRFSEENYIDMLQNPKLKKETREYIIARTHKLLAKTDPTMDKRIRSYEEQYLDENLAPVISSPGMRERFVREKNRTNIYLRYKVYDLFHKKFEMPDASEDSGSSDAAGASDASGASEDASSSDAAGSSDADESSSPDFAGLRAQAAIDGEEACGGNEFYVKRSYYEHYIVHVMEEEKDSGIKTGYSVSPEYDDLNCFLMTCRDLEITPLIIITPVNGYWYDYIGFPADAREDYYSQIREMAAAYDAEVCDFSDREYEPYFMEDTIHIGWKGWVDACEAIYRFAKEK